MSDIEAGDIVVCINDTWNDLCRAPNECSAIYAQLAPRKGSHWKVARTCVVERPEEGLVLYLCLEGMPSDKSYHHAYFRKVRPDESEQLREEQEVRSQLVPA